MSELKTKPDIAELDWIRIFDPVHIPVYLIDQIKDREFTTEAFIKYQEAVCLEKSSDKVVVNPFNLLYVLADKEKRVMGFLWAVVDVLNGALCINNYSVNRRYWGKGEAIAKLKEKVVEIQKGGALKKIYWFTKSSKYCEKHGFTRSKNILYEYSEEVEEEESGNGKVSDDGERCAANRGS